MIVHRKKLRDTLATCLLPRSRRSELRRSRGLAVCQPDARHQTGIGKHPAAHRGAGNQRLRPAGAEIPACCRHQRQRIRVRPARCLLPSCGASHRPLHFATPRHVPRAHQAERRNDQRGGSSRGAFGHSRPRHGLGSCADIFRDHHRALLSGGSKKRARRSWHWKRAWAGGSTPRTWSRPRSACSRRSTSTTSNGWENRSRKSPGRKRGSSSPGCRSFLRRRPMKCALFSTGLPRSAVRRCTTSRRHSRATRSLSRAATNRGTPPSP